MHGRGIYTYSDGSKWDGTWENNKLNGYAITYYADGSINQEGIFKDDKFLYAQKKTKSALPNCVGSWSTTNWDNCIGTYTLDNGNKHVGNFRNGKPHGQGTRTYARGSKYVGEYKNGKRDGQGTFTSANGYKYVGEWKEAKIDGYGTHTWSDGTKYVGMWKNRKANGRGVLTKPNGKSLEGFWEKGKLLIKEKRTVYEAGLIPPTPFNLNNPSTSDD